jgi:hypothetical protein
MIASLLFALAGLIAFLKCERIQNLLQQGGSLVPLPATDTAASAPPIVTYPPQVVPQLAPHQLYMYQVGLGAPAAYSPRTPQQG